MLMSTFDKGPNSKKSPTIWRKWEGKVVKQALAGWNGRIDGQHGHNNEKR